jgi:flagellar assembly factor FliW
MIDSVTRPPDAGSAVAPTTDDLRELPTIEMVHPMPGFPDVRRFALVELDDDGLLSALHAIEQPDLRFLVVPPHPFFPDYAPVVDDATVADLGVTSAAEVQVLVILTAGDSLGETTANLLAPVLVNTSNRRACQVILDDNALSVSTPLVA